MSPHFLRALEKADLVGLSLDGPDAYSHDSFREKPGNFDRVMDLLRGLNEKSIPMIVRTIVSKRNASGVPRIALLLGGLPSVVRWSLLEFSPIGEGATNRDKYLLDPSSFERIAKEAEQLFSGPATIDIYRAAAQAGTYALITPSGYLYGTTMSPADVFFPTVGSLLHDHLAILAERLPFSKDNHTKRYKRLIPS